MTGAGESMAEVMAQAIRMHLRTIAPAQPGEAETVSALRGALALYDRDEQDRAAYRLEEGMGQVTRTQQDLLRVAADIQEARRRAVEHIAARDVRAAIQDRMEAIIVNAAVRPGGRS